MNPGLLALALTSLALAGCANSMQPSPAATPTSTAGAWEVNMHLINQVGAAATASFTIADGHTKVIQFTEPAQDLTENDLVLVGQRVTVDVEARSRQRTATSSAPFSAPKLTAAKEGGGTLARHTGTGKFTCT